MNKSLLVSLVLFCGVILSACGNKTEIQEDENIETVVDQESQIESVDEPVISCADAIKQYLDNADKNGEGETIKNGDNVVVDYIGRLDDETVFDTSVESVAKACGKYSEGRNYEEGLPFEVGAGQMIKGFDEGVVGMKKGQTKTVTFGADKGYGERDENYIFTYSANEIGDLSQYSEGMSVCLSMYQCGVITNVSSDEMTVDFNHELAGKTLTFDVTVKSIN